MFPTDINFWIPTWPVMFQVESQKPWVDFKLTGLVSLGCDIMWKILWNQFCNETWMSQNVAAAGRVSLWVQVML